jgi:hypothetical protein
MKLTKIVLILLITLLSNSVFSQVKPEDMVSAFYEKLKINSDEAINDFMKPISKDEETLENISKSYKKAKNIYGNLGKIELVKRTLVGENLIELNYLFHHEKYPLIFKFIFYRFDKEWKQVNFLFNDEIRKEFFGGSD